jgi:hypothetical protein
MKLHHEEFLFGFACGAFFPGIGAAFAYPKAHESLTHFEQFSDHSTDTAAHMMLQKFSTTCDSTPISDDKKEAFCATYKDLRQELALNKQSSIHTYAEKCDNLLAWPDATQDLHNKILKGLIKDSNFFIGITAGSTLSACMLLIEAGTGELTPFLTQLHHTLQSINKKQ